MMLTDDYSDIVFVWFAHSSGLGGEGCIIIVKEDGEKMQLSVSEYDEMHPERTVNLLEREAFYDDTLKRRKYTAENRGYVYCTEGVLCREDYYKTVEKMLSDKPKESIWDFEYFECVEKIFENRNNTL